MGGTLRGAAIEAARLALTIGSASSGTADAASFVADLAEQFPLIGPTFEILNAIREKVPTAKCNREELAALHERCTYITACTIVKCQRSDPLQVLDVTPLEECVKAVEQFADRCRRRKRLTTVLKATRDKIEIASLHWRVVDLAADMGLAGIVAVEERVDDLRGLLVRTDALVVQWCPFLGFVFVNNVLCRCLQRLSLSPLTPS